MSSSAPPVKKTRKNAPGARLDPAWKHGKEIDAAAKKVQCKYCNVIRAGGIYRLKHHLACTRKDVEPCPQVSDEVRKEMLELIRFVNWMKEFTKGKELVRPGVTRFATSYLTMRRLLELKGELIAFFASEKWRGSSHAKKKKGQEICNIIFDTQNFWPNVELCLKIASPLIKVLRMVDSDDKPAMGFLYKAIEHAKEEIKANLRSAKKRYEPVHSKRRNRLAQKRMNDLVFVMYNLRLREREREREKQKMMNVEKDPFENFPSDDEWITEIEDPVLPKDNEWLRILDENQNHDTTDEEENDEVEVIASHIMRTIDETPSESRGKRKQVNQMHNFHLVNEEENVDGLNVINEDVVQMPKVDESVKIVGHNEDYGFGDICYGFENDF
ncbi:hypothetical protein ZIOFF_027444 [Zingiber officinale]|uniref:BED-type domain-containing protein n=1 Tax=Zingiber officinale TaxID=94328 RepID=A0A8J5GMU0_ZINOF|nr:hypothetical protein ZIOFF_027444 [Zingiber officinale]